MPTQQTDVFEPEKPLTADEMKEQSESRELAPLDDRRPHTGVPAYREYSAEMIQLIGKQVMPRSGFTPPELYMVLELAATYALDPLSKEIWAVRMSDNANEPVTIMVGVEGMKAIAARHPDYLGFRNLEVYENDQFLYTAQPKQLPDGTFSHVEHSFDLTKDRGKLLGAYAEVYREGRPPVFFWAPLEEYQRTEGKTPWKKQKTAMIRKCALANALRASFRISGLYIAEEMSNAPLVRNGTRARNAGADTVEPEEAIRAMVDDEYTAQRLIDLFATDELRPKYLPAKQRLMIAGKNDEEILELVAQLEREILDAGGQPPPPRDPSEFVAEGEIMEEPEEEDIEFPAPQEPGEQATMPTD